ncbi:putative quinol monooxygenase [Devosia sp.]|uniref:putative quinol monooxygenase n=1 Tax=Devosia sp. TaxID=1871048 RepID=UPI003A9032C1
MIVVCGHLQIHPGQRDAFLAASRPAVVAARENAACSDFAVSDDLVAPDRVNIFELWDDRAALDAFRDAGPGEDLSAMIAAYHIRELEAG